MKASELRIGNYVYHNHSIGMKLPAQITEGKDIDMFEELKPIQLTEEWLLKFGFEKKIWKVKKSIYFELDKIEILLEDSFYKNGVTYFKSNMLFEYFPKYVHQLQNLYFALTNDELKII